LCLSRAAGLAHELVHTAARLAGRYDVAVTAATLAPGRSHAG